MRLTWTASVLLLQVFKSYSWTTSCFLEKNCAHLPNLTDMWDMINKYRLRQSPIPVKECFRRVPLTMAGCSRLRQLRDIINSLTL